MNTTLAKRVIVGIIFTGFVFTTAAEARHPAHFSVPSQVDRCGGCSGSTPHCVHVGIGSDMSGVNAWQCMSNLDSANRGQRSNNQNIFSAFIALLTTSSQVVPAAATVAQQYAYVPQGNFQGMPPCRPDLSSPVRNASANNNTLGS